MTDSIPTTAAPPADVAATIRAFLAEVVGDAPEPDEDIFARGTVTSLFALQLIAFVENTFGIEVEPEDLDFANFRTVDAVTAFVDGKRAATSRG
ncbi:acyl carrier protein [Micromonospora sp. WMMD964]|uniref:acyl carrier protein n=1 Tax=Micromonospora sp. WMMD964 TaxID=3016091 RepID=UPI00249A16BF|nr:acyl carrier protein [Micromonospora sp. WMMD964]WFE98696.1 acyl carrier protein [Micromonospora sp. WMMD964]